MDQLDDECKRIAEGYAELCKDRYDVQLDFSPESIEILDRYLAETFPEGCTFNTTIVSVAAYVGETLRRSIGGKWIQPSQGPPFVDIAGAGANVYVWAKKCLSNQPGETLSSKVSAFQRVVTERSPTPK